MARRQRTRNTNTNSNSNGNFSSKIDELNDSINNLIDTIEHNSKKVENSNRSNNFNNSRGISFSAISRYTSNASYRKQQLGQFSKKGQVMGRYMSINSEKLGSKFLGIGKAGSAAAKGIGIFGKGLGVVSKFLGGPFVTAVLYAIDALKLVGSVINDWKLATSEMYKHQTKQEQLQYELSKQEMVIENQMKIENVSAQGDIQLKMLETQGATMLEALKLTSAQYAKSVDIALGPLTKGINETAYEAANARIDAAVQKQKLDLHKDQREQQYGRYKEQRELQQIGKIAGLEAEKGVAQTQYKIDSQRAAMEHTQYMEKNHNYQMLIRDEHNNLLNYDAKNGKVTEDNSVGGGNIANGGKNSKVITNTNEAGIGDIMNSDMLSANAEKFIGYQEGQHAKQMAKAEYQWEKLREAADYQKTVIDSEYDLAKTQQEYAFNIANKQLDISVESKEIVIDTAAEVKKTWLQLAQKTEQWLENFDSITNDLGINLGYTSKEQLHSYQTSMFNIVENVASKFGKSIEEAAKMQQAFSENTGRNRIMGERDYGNLFGLGKYLGDDGLAANYASEMEIFNAGVSDSVDMLDETLQDVNRIGLNGRKYTKTLVDNLKLAQKYNFKDGTKGLMNMAKWAENTRFNMNSLSGMLDKVSEGGLEGIIKQGAEFQVLGGHAAMNADPIAMWYERYADPQAFAKRMQDMTKGYGQLDKKTGETTFSVNEQMMMEQLAKIQGRSYEDVANEVRARNKKEVVAKQFRSNFNEEEQAFISNNAIYNKQTGQFQVKVKGANGKYENRDVSQLTQKDLENLMPERHEERMEKYMQDILSAVEGVKGEEIAEKANLAAATYEEMLNAYTERTRIAHESYAAHRDQYIEETKKGMAAATAAFKDYIGIFNEGNKDVEESVKNIESSANNISVALNDTANIIAQANGKIAAAYGSEYVTPKFTQILKKNEEERKYMSEHIPFKPEPHAFPDIKKINEESAVNNVNNKTSVKIPFKPQENNVLTNPWTTQVDDGIVRGKNAPIVTKVNDSIVKSDPKDVAIFAKEGGVIGNFLNDLYNDVHSANSGTISLDTVNVTISGSLDLSSGGQSVNIINELQTNPMLLRSLSRMLAQQISSAMNGGRGTLPMEIGSV